MGAFKRLLRPRNVALGLGVTVPGAYFVAFKKDAEGNPAPARYWQIKAYSLVPLRAASRLWGGFNSITLPVWFRPYGFRFYAWVFGADLEEIADQDLTHYENLGEFFYRQLRPEARPLANALMVSPCDGKVLQYGEIKDNAHIEQVKGMRYPLERFLGGPAAEGPSSSPSDKDNDGINLERDEKFAEMNGLSYTVDELVGAEKEGSTTTTPSTATPSTTTPTDEAPNPINGHPGGMNLVQKGDATATKKGILDTPVWLPSGGDSNKLFYCVIYLAPGDYHRFHSPVSWIVTMRRHFVGELFSVAPYFQNRLADLFCLNERVALLGRWKHGFFSMTPVGATNVGSIVINFDKFLKTNQRGTVANTCYEASYKSASPVLHGLPLNAGEEMGGFRLGSTVVLVFEAPQSFKFHVTRNSTVKMGEALGDA